MCSNNLIVSVTVMAAAISDDRDSDEISLLAAIFTQLGDTLATIVAQRELEEKRKEL